MEPYDCGYAPTVVKHRGRFYLTASGAPLIDYRPLQTMKATKVRLCVTGHPVGIQPGVMNFTVFGTAEE